MSKLAFGSEANVDSALEQGLIDVHDVLFLSEGKVGWINKEGKKVIVDNAKQILFVDELPESGTDGIVYVVNNKFYTWDGSDFKPIAGAGMMESEVDEKLNAAKAEVTDAANAYTDEQIANAFTVVEF